MIMAKVNKSRKSKIKNRKKAERNKYGFSTPEWKKKLIREKYS